MAAEKLRRTLLLSSQADSFEVKQTTSDQHKRD